MSDDYSKAIKVIDRASREADVAEARLRSGDAKAAQKSLDKAFKTLTSSLKRFNRLYDDEYERAIMAHLDVHGKMSVLYADIAKAMTGGGGGGAAK